MSVNNGAPLAPGTSDDPSDLLSRAIDEFEAGDDADESEDNDPQDSESNSQGDANPAKGRDPENVRRELLRKQEKLESKVMSRLDAMQAALQQATSSFAGMLVGQQTQAQSDPNDLDSLSIDQILAGKQNVLEKNDPALLLDYNALVARKLAQEEARKILTQERKSTQYQTTQQEFTKMAVDQFGQAGLADKGSAFYREVMAEVERRKAWGTVPPSVVYDAAAFVAGKQGIQANQAPRPTSGLARGRTTAPAGRPTQEDTAELDKAIASMEAAAGKPFDEKARERIRKGYLELKKNPHLYGQS